MKARILTSLVGIPLIFAAVWYGPTTVLLAILILASIATCEIYGLYKIKNRGLPRLIGVIWVCTLILGEPNSPNYSTFIITSSCITCIGIFASILWLIVYSEKSRFVTALLCMTLGCTYIGILMAHFPMYYDIENSIYSGKIWLLFAILATFTTDTAALLGGKTIGRHALAPKISPNKTWEGSISGIIGSILFSIVFCYISKTPEYLWQIAALGATVGVVSQLGDLTESKIKRTFNVKNTGSLLPGHGGLLDRLDSLLWSVPITYYLIFTLF